MSARHLCRAGAERDIHLEVAPGVSPSGEAGVLLIRRHPKEPLSLTFLASADAWDLVLALRRVLPERLEIGRASGSGYSASDDPPPGTRPPRDTGLPIRERPPRAER